MSESGPEPVSIVVAVSQVGGCPALRAGERWVLSGREVRPVAGAKLCLGGLAAIQPYARKMSDAADDDEPAPVVVRCAEPGCEAVFLAEATRERRRNRGSSPPRGVERRRDLLAMTAGRLLHDPRPFLQRLQPEVAAAMTAASKLNRYGDGAAILNEGELVDCLFLVDEGRVAVVRQSARDGAETTLAVLGAGECIGEMSLLTGEPSSASVVALGDAAVRLVPGAVMAELIATSADLSRAFCRLLAARLRAVNLLFEGGFGRRIVGQLVTMAPVNVIQTLHSSLLTGTLVLTGEESVGRIGVRDGQVVSATLGALAGDEAFHALMGWTSGEFAFESGTDAVPEGAAIEMDTFGLIMESMQRLDEASL